MQRRSWFGPLLLIAVGLIWLLVSAQVIPSQNLWALTQIWPYVLIALGLGMLLSAQWAGAGRIISILVLVGAILAVVFAPQLGWARVPNWDFDGDFGGGVSGSGKMESETRKVDAFHAIAVESPAEIAVVIRQGNAQSVEVEADDNVLPQLRTQTRDGVLYIENSERDWAVRVDPSQPVKVTITVQDLDAITFASAGTLQVENLQTDKLRLVLSGAGEVTLDELDVQRFEGVLSGAGSIKADGTADNVDVTVSGFGSLDAPNLTSSTADVSISGAGSVTLRVTDELDAVVSGAGSVNYLGTPRVDKTIRGAGSVNKIGD